MDPKHAVIHQAADSGLPWGMILQWLATFGFPLVIQVLMVIVPLLKPGTKIHDIAQWIEDALKKLSGGQPMPPLPVNP